MDSEAILKRMEKLEAVGAESPAAASLRLQTLALYTVALQVALLREAYETQSALTFLPTHHLNRDL